MNIKFITAGPQPKTLTFRDVEEDQFFIDGCGNFCQKSNSETYVTIASERGLPFSTIEESVDEDEDIRAILDKVTKIEFN